jgi:hypothetical protein
MDRFTVRFIDPAYVDPDFVFSFTFNTEAKAESFADRRVIGEGCKLISITPQTPDELRALVLDMLRPR